MDGNAFKAGGVRENFCWDIFLLLKRSLGWKDLSLPSVTKRPTRKLKSSGPRFCEISLQDSTKHTQSPPN